MKSAPFTHGSINGTLLHSGRYRNARRYRTMNKRKDSKEKPGSISISKIQNKTNRIASAVVPRKASVMHLQSDQLDFCGKEKVLATYNKKDSRQMTVSPYVFDPLGLLTVTFTSAKADISCTSTDSRLTSPFTTHPREQTL